MRRKIIMPALIVNILVLLLTFSITVACYMSFKYCSMKEQYEILRRENIELLKQNVAYNERLIILEPNALH